MANLINNQVEKLWTNKTKKYILSDPIPPSNLEVKE